MSSARPKGRVAPNGRDRRPEPVPNPPDPASAWARPFFPIRLPSSEWLLQGHLWSEQISEFQAQGCRQFFSFHPALPAVKIAFVPRRFHPAIEQESPQRMHEWAGNGLGRMRADLLQLGGLAFVWEITEVA